jgi:uncharacterized protein (TIGR04255 family)
MIPQKLKDDAITEAVCEIRFERPEAELSELVIGRLLDFPEWASIPIKERLNIGEIPAAVREMEPGFKFQPVVELRDPKGNHLVRIGANVASLHFKPPYPGWEVVFPEVQKLCRAVSKNVRGVKVGRLGLRYINAITSTRHKLARLFDLELALSVKGQRFEGPVFLTYRTQRGLYRVITRIASPELLQAALLPAGTTAVIDIDVSLEDSMPADSGVMIKWFDEAHSHEKQEFFGLLPAALTEKLMER